MCGMPSARSAVPALARRDQPVQFAAAGTTHGDAGFGGAHIYFRLLGCCTAGAALTRLGLVLLLIHLPIRVGIALDRAPACVFCAPLRPQRQRLFFRVLVVLFVRRPAARQVELRAVVVQASGGAGLPAGQPGASARSPCVRRHRRERLRKATRVARQRGERLYGPWWQAAAVQDAQQLSETYCATHLAHRASGRVQRRSRRRLRGIGACG